MAGISLKKLGSTIDVDKLLVALKDLFQDLEDQLNNRANIYVSTDGKIPTTLSPNDLVVIATGGTINILVKKKNGYVTLTAAMIGGLLSRGANFVGFQSVSGAPALSNFPNPNDWGFFTNTAGPNYYLVANFAGAIKKIALT